jgi:hypothetical protein
MAHENTIGGVRARSVPSASTPRRRTEPFLAVHVQLVWVRAAVRAGAGDVAWAVLYRYGLARRAPFAASAGDLAVIGISHDTARRQFQRLEQAGLVRVERLCGKKPVITVLDHLAAKDSHV